MYRIVELCDPYHSEWHYRGQKVLRRNLATPVKWVIEDGLTLEEAKANLMKLAKMCRSYEHGLWSDFDDDDVRYLQESLKEDFPDEEHDTSWYEGPGIYCDCAPVLLEGGMSFDDDVESFRIEEED